MAEGRTVPKPLEDLAERVAEKERVVDVAFAYLKVVFENPKKINNPDDDVQTFLRNYSKSS
jgi:hypothetical protein